ncbi:MAG: AsmA family protein [Beijerinckiaceae bacterium]
MRDIITGLAVVLILCLTGALIAPHLIDWDSRRADISEQLTKALGQPVRIDGPVGLELLPTPSLKLSMLDVGGSGPMQASAGRIKLQLAIPPLLRGEFRITDAVVHSPRIVIHPARMAKGASAGKPDIAALPTVGFDRLSIIDGHIRVVGADGKDTMAAKTIDGTLEASSLSGPFKGNLQFDMESQRRTLRFSTGQIGPAGLRVKTLTENEAAATRTDFEGDINIVDGQLALNGQIGGSGNAAFPLNEGFAQIIWRASGKLEYKGTKGRLDKIEIGLGNGERRIVLTGTTDIDLQSEVPVQTTLSAKQADLDRLLGGEDSKLASSPVSLLQKLNAQPAMASKRAWLKGKLDLSIGSILLGGDKVGAARIVIASSPLPSDKPFSLLSAEAELPGRTTASFLTLPDNAQSGQLALESRDMARLSGWLHGRPARATAVRNFKVSGTVGNAGNSIVLRDAIIKADDMTLSGSVQLDQLPAGPKLTMDLNADQLEIAKLPDIDNTESQSDIDLDLTLNAKRVRYLGVGAGSIVAKVRRSADLVTIDKLDIIDVGGANLSGAGHFSPRQQDFKLKLDATKLDALVELADRLLPPAYAKHLVSRSRFLSPARLTFDASSVLDGGINYQDLRVAGTVSDTTIDGRFRLLPDGTIAGKDGLSADVSAASVANFLRQVGLETIGIANAGGVKLRLRGNGLLPSMPEAKWTLSGNLGDLALDVDARQVRDTEQPFDGKITMRSRDLAPLAQTLLVTVPTVPPGTPFDLKAGIDLRGYKITFRDMTMVAGSSEVKGEIAFNLLEFGRVAGQLKTGALDASSIAPLIFGSPQQPLPTDIWSKERFAPAAAMTLPGDLWIQAERVDIVGKVSLEQPKFVVRFENGIIYLEHVSAEWNGGKLKGQATLRRSGGAVNLTGRMALDQLPIDRLPGSGIKGLGSTQLDFSAIGDSPFAMVSAMAGSGRVDVRQAEVKSLGEGALDNIIASKKADTDAVSADQLSSVLLGQGKRNLAVPALQTPLNLASGVLRVGPLSLPAKTEDIRASLALDLRSLDVTGEVDHISRIMPKGWSGPSPRAKLVWRGPIGQTTPSVDTTGLANGLTAIAIQRETERIEALEQDQRERTQFNRRLRASEEERRAQEAARRAAEEERRRAEAERQAAARAEAARLETLRQETLRQRIDNVIRTAPPIPTETLNQPLVITPPAARP